jgi:hypothetical protein
MVPTSTTRYVVEKNLVVRQEQRSIRRRGEKAKQLHRRAPTSVMALHLVT